MADISSESIQGSQEVESRTWGMGQAWLGLGVGVASSAVLSSIGIIIYILTSGTLGSINLDDEVVLMEYITEAALSPFSSILGFLGLWFGFYLGCLIAVKRSGQGWKGTLGLSFKRWDWIWGLLLAVGLTGVEMLFIYGFSVAGGDPAAFSNTDPIEGAKGSILFPLVLLSAAIGAPFFEELFFRGLVLKSVMKRWGTVAGIITSGVAFGVMHWPGTLSGRVLVGLISMIGVVFAVVAVKTKRLGVVVFAHVFFNSLAVILLLSS